MEFVLGAFCGAGLVGAAWVCYEFYWGWRIDHRVGTYDAPRPSRSRGRHV